MGSKMQYGQPAYRTNVCQPWYEVYRVDPRDGRSFRYATFKTEGEAVDCARSLKAHGEINAPHVYKVSEISY